MERKCGGETASVRVRIRVVRTEEEGGGGLSNLRDKQRENSITTVDTSWPLNSDTSRLLMMEEPQEPQEPEGPGFPMFVQMNAR